MPAVNPGRGRDLDYRRTFARPALPAHGRRYHPDSRPRPWLAPFPGQDTGSWGPSRGPVIVAIHPAGSAGRMWWRAPITGNDGTAAVIPAGGRLLAEEGKSTMPEKAFINAAVTVAQPECSLLYTSLNHAVS